MYDHRPFRQDPKKQIIVISLFIVVFYFFLLWLQGRSEAKDILIQGRYGYVAWGSAGLGVLDLQDPALPSGITYFDTSGDSKRLALLDKYIFVADGNKGIQVFNIANPTDPQEVGSYNLDGGAAEDIVINNKEAFVAFGEKGLEILNVSIPDKPVKRGSIDTPGNATKITLSGNLVYIADGERGMRIVNISNSTIPFDVGNYDTPGIAYDIAILGQYAIIADGKSGILIVDISDPTKPQTRSNLPLSGIARGITLIENKAYVTLGDAGIAVVNLGNPDKPTELSTTETPGYAYKALINKNLIFIPDGADGINIFTDEGHQLRSKGTFEFPGKASPLQIFLSFITCFLGLIFWSIFFAQFLLPVRTVGERYKAIGSFWLYVFGMHGPAVFIRNGEVVDQPQKLGGLGKLMRLFGPISYGAGALFSAGTGVIMLDSASAGVLRTAFKFTRAIGPGVVFTAAHERLAGTVDLHQQTKVLKPMLKPGQSPFDPQGENESEIEYRARCNSCKITSATTRDGIEIIPMIIAVFRLKSEYGEGNTQFGYNPQSVWRAIVHQSIKTKGTENTEQRHISWDQLPTLLVVDLWREYLRKYSLNELFLPSLEDPIQPDKGKRTAIEIITSEIRQRLTHPLVSELDAYGRYTGNKIPSEEFEMLNRRGIQVIAVVITDLRLPRAVDEQISQRWKTKWELKTTSDRAESGRARRIKEFEGQNAAIKKYAEWVSIQLAKSLSDIPANNPNLDDTITYILESSIEESKYDMELHRRMGTDSSLILRLIEWIRSH